MNEVLSLIVTALAAMFVMWINGKQHEFDQMQNKSH
jgi:hypothetical protein